MRRPPKRRKILTPHTKRAAPPPPVPLDRRTKLFFLCLILAPGILFMGVHELRLYRKARAEEVRFRTAYHLTDDQRSQTRVLEKAYEVRYRSLRDRAEASRHRLEERSAEANEVTSELRQLFDQAQADREACWTEEIEHHRRMSQVMNPEDGQRYFAGAEATYRDRKKRPDGLLVLPHD